MLATENEPRFVKPKLKPIPSLHIMCVAFLTIAAHLEASIITVPNLPPGSQYRLVFVTDGTYSAQSPDISTYNIDVTNEANVIPQLALLGATWTVIASTELTSASSNIGASTGGIYRLDGTLVANGTTGLFSGSLLSPIDITSTGGPATGFVWTGTNTDGTANLYPMGGVAPANATTTGFPTHSDDQWVFSTFHRGSSQLLPLYAISSELTVPTPTPEPRSSFEIAVGIGLLLITLQRCSRRSRF